MSKHLMIFCGKVSYSIVPLIMLVTTVAHAADGSLDNTFGGDGIVTTEHVVNGSDVVLQSDGKIVIVGTSSSHVTLVRYLPNGNIDTTLNSTGIITTNIGFSDEVREVAIDADGKFLVAGSSLASDRVTKWDFALVRYNKDGSLDTTFDIDGIVTTTIDVANDYITSMILQSNGQILVAGVSADADGFNRFALARYNSNGSLDSSFSDDGILITDIDIYGDVIHDIIIQPDGKIVAVGQSSSGIALVRYHVNGSLDDSFGQNGIVITSVGSSSNAGQIIAIQPDGKILVAGNGYNGTDMDFILIRYNSDGSLDDNFANAGIAFFSPANFFPNLDEFVVDMILQPDGNILLAGVVNGTHTRSSVLVRLNNDGSLDNNFASNGSAHIPIGGSNCIGGGPHLGTGVFAMAQQLDGNILLAGTGIESCDLSFSIARVLNAIDDIDSTEITNSDINNAGVTNLYWLMLFSLSLLGRIKYITHA